MNTILFYLGNQAAEAGRKVKDIFMDKKGESFVDSALKILISVVIGALLLAGLYTLFKTNVLPTLSNKVSELFNYNN